MMLNNSTLKKYKGKSPKSSRPVSVDRILLKSLMLSRGIEFYKDLAQHLGISQFALYNLVEGRKWYPSIAKKIEDFFGVERGRIFKREAE